MMPVPPCAPESKGVRGSAQCRRTSDGAMGATPLLDFLDRFLEGCV